MQQVEATKPEPIRAVPSLEKKYSQKTLGYYWRLTKIVVTGTGFAVLALITAAITRPAVSDVVPRVIMYSFLAATVVCVFLMVPTLIRFFISAQKDRLRRNAGLQVNNAADL